MNIQTRMATGFLLKQRREPLTLISTRGAVELSYNHHTRTLSKITVGSRVALQNETKRWDIHGIVMEIGPHRRYFVKTQSARVLVRNRRFL